MLKETMMGADFLLIPKE